MTAFAIASAPLTPGKSRRFKPGGAIMLRAFVRFAAIFAFSIPSAWAAATCSSCDAWNKPHAPFRLFGNSYYVGTAELSSVLITSEQGHVLIDGALAISAPQIVANIRSLGFRIEDVKLILNSHVHFDHAGGIAELQRLSGAAVKASPSSAAVLRTGKRGKDDPQFAIPEPALEPVAHVDTVKDEETLHVGPLSITAHFTPGHTPGGTTWSWESCEGARCLHMVYADSLSTVSADNFLFSHTAAYPSVLKDFDKSFAVMRSLPCDIMVSSHPGVSNLWDRLQKRDQGDNNALIDKTSCRRFADDARTALGKRLAQEKAK